MLTATKDFFFTLRRFKHYLSSGIIQSSRSNMLPNNKPWPHRSICLRAFYQTASLKDFTKFRETSVMESAFVKLLV